MSKLDEIMDFLNDEERSLVNKYLNTKSYKESLKTLSPDEVAKEIVLNIVIHYYISQDRAYLITDEQDRRWTEVQDKAYELGIIDFKRFS